MAFRVGPTPTDEEQRELSRRARAGDRAAHDEMVERNIRLVLAVLGRRGTADDEALSLGLEGLMSAVRCYDPDRGPRFSTYATTTIYRTLARYHRDWPVHVPAYLRDGTGRRRQAEECVAAASVVLAAEVWSLSRTLAMSQEGRAEFVDVAAPAEEHPEPDEPDPADRLREILDRSWLTEQEREVLERRMGLFGRPSESLEDIGASMGVTKERVRQIQSQALECLTGSPAVPYRIRVERASEEPRCTG